MKEAIDKIKQQTRQGMVWFQKQWISAKKLASDGCTGIPDLGLTRCCRQHDADYTVDSRVSRLKGDCRLVSCIWYKASKTETLKKKAFYYLLGPVFFISVRLAGWYHYQKEKE